MLEHPDEIADMVRDDDDRWVRLSAADHGLPVWLRAGDIDAIIGTRRPPDPPSGPSEEEKTALRWLAEELGVADALADDENADKPARKHRSSRSASKRKNRAKPKKRKRGRDQ